MSGDGKAAGACALRSRRRRRFSAFRFAFMPVFS
jgi:hypothetical protein